ncbi:MAG: hypothetical protein D6734_00495 [Candidatus Schekmanbacteria bacterium]|nr:MAG: hypothetical protein D6734_00495 [Candidatus Schekmanbacteria bacterium]
MEKREKIVIDAKGIYYRELNEKIRDAIYNLKCKEIHLNNVNGQRYIGDGIEAKVTIVINGVPGNDLAAFMNGPTIIVNDNAQDAVGNTMNNGKVIVKGHSSDVIGYGMRGGKIFIKGDVGYRVGIHMKAYKNTVPYIICGGRAGDFLGEYMAGGVLAVLGLDENDNRPLTGDYLGTGMHGGVIYIRGEVDERTLGKEVGIVDFTEKDMQEFGKILKEYADDLDLDFDEIMSKPFTKIVPISHRPYGKLYSY